MADPITVATQAELQALINSAAAGTVITLANGTHLNLTSTLYVRNGITLQGESEAGVVIDASGLQNGNGYAINVDDDNTTLAYFTLIGGGGASTAETARGIKAQAAGDNPRLDGLVISHVTVNNFRVAEIDVNGADGALISDVTVDGMGTSGAGIALTDVLDATLHNISSTNNLWGGVAIYAGGAAFAASSNGTHGVTFTGTFDAPVGGGQAQPILLQAENGYTITNYALPAAYDYAVYNAAAPEYLIFFATPEEATTYALSAPGSVIYENAADTGAFVEGNIVVYPGMDLAAAYAAAEPNQVVHIIGNDAPGSENDTYSARNNAPDWFTGGAGDDTFVGGSGGGDRFVYEHANAGDITGITKIGQNVFITTTEGTDGLNGVEEIQFANGDVLSISGTNLVVDTTADTNSAVEDGVTVTSNVLTNDHDLDGASFVVHGIVAGASSTPVSGGLDTPVAGTYGTLTISANGAYSYTANNADTLALNEHGTDTFTYTVNDNGALVTETITIDVTGTNDDPTIVTTDVVGTVFENGDLDAATNETPASDFAVNYTLSAPVNAALAMLTTSGAIGDTDLVPELLTNIVAELPNGSIQDAFAIVFNTLDDFYDDGVNYSNVAHNTSALRLGMAYADYLIHGGRPLTDVMVKVAANRSQSLHDNLLGNFGTATLQDRFPADHYDPSGATSTGIYAEIRDAGFSFLQDRPYFGGYTGDDTAPSRSFDLAHDLVPVASGQLVAADVDGDNLTWTIVGDGQGLYGSLHVNADGTWYYDIDQGLAEPLGEGDIAPEVFQVMVDDGHGGTATTSITINVNGTNDAPEFDASFDWPTTLTEDEHGTAIPSVNVSALLDAAVVDPDGDAVSLVLTFTYPSGSGLSSWSATVDENGDAAYDVPASHKDYNGPVSVLITATDENGAVSTKTIDVTITPSNDAPTFDFVQDFSEGANGIGFGGSYGGLTIVDSFIDRASNTISGNGDFAIITEGTNFSGKAYGAGPYHYFDGDRTEFVDGMTAGVRVYLDTGWNAGEGFEYSVSTLKQDGSFLRDFVFHVIKTSTGLYVGGDNNASDSSSGGLNQNPNGKTQVADSGWYTIRYTFGQTTGANPALQVTMDLVDASDNVVATITRSNPNDLVDTVAGGNNYGWFARVEVAGGIAIDDITLTGVDSGAATEGAGSTVSLDGALLFNDIDGDAIPVGTVLGVAQGPGSYIGTFHAEVVEDPAGSAGGTIRWTFDANVDSLTDGDHLVQTYDVTVSDGNGGSATKTVTVTIDGTNDAPTVDATIGDMATDEDAAFSFAIPANAFADAEGVATLTYTATLDDGSDLPPWLHFDGHTLSGTPTNDWVGTLSIKVTATDDKNASVSQTFDLTVNNQNDAPTFGFHQGFESDRDGVFDTTTPGWSGYGSVDVVSALGTIVAADGSQFAVLKEPLPNDEDTGPFSRFGGYRAEFVDGLTAETKVYLDTSWNLGEGFAYTVAANGADGAHRRDFAFTVAMTADGLKVGTSNGVDHENPLPTSIPNTGDTVDNTIGASGWYTLQHVFNNVGGVLSVTLNVLDSLGNIVFSDVLSDPSDTIDLIGGNRYAWYARIEVPQGIAVDDIALYGVDSGSDTQAADGSVNITGQLVFDDVDGDTVTVVDVQPQGSGYLGDLVAVISEDSTGASGGTITWTFSGDVSALSEDDTVVQTYEITIDDGNGGTATQLVSVTITGINDAPVAEFAVISATEDGPSQTGKVTATDVDDVDTGLIYTALNAIDGLTFDNQGNYAFDPSHPTYQSLANGEPLQLVLNYSVEDEDGAIDYGTLTINLVGSNDAPVILGTSDLAGEVTEPAATNTLVQDSGTIHVEDDGGSYSFRSPYVQSNDYGVFVLNPFNGEWTFTLGTGPEVQKLNDGDTAHTSFIVNVRDGNGVTTTTNVDITIHGTNELIDGTVSDDVLNGTPYQDVINAGDGDDIVYGGSSADVINGGAGDDTLYGGSGNDTIDAGSGDDTVDGGSGDDIINAGTGDDFILGGSGHDTLSGNAGHDDISGGSGDDILWGGAGRDTLTGGDGADVFKFADAVDSVRGGARDTIMDFEQGVDKIDLSQYDANTDLGSDTDAFFFRGAGAATRKEDAGFLKYYHENGNTFIVGGTDNNPDGLGELLIELKGIHELQASDFIGLSAYDPDTGTSADDVFYAGTAQNTFTGNGGADRFVFTDWTQSKYGNSWDIITDWNSDNVIDLSGIDAVPGGADDAYTGVYTGPANRITSAGQIKIFEQANNTFVVADTTGDGLADIKIQIDGINHNLGLDNFIL